MVCRDRAVHLLPEASFDPAEITYAAVWKPAPGELAGFAHLRTIFNLGAGVVRKKLTPIWAPFT